MSAHEEKRGEGEQLNLGYQYFLIQSDLYKHVLEVADGNTNAGTPVYAFRRTGAAKQKWREDPHSLTIRTALNDFCMDTDGSQLNIDPYQPCKATQKWVYKGNAIINNSSGMALEITGDQSGAKVIMATPNGQANQSWSFVPVK